MAISLGVYGLPCSSHQVMASTSEAGEASARGPCAGAVRAWQVWVDVCQQSADPRLIVAGKIFARERAELQAAL